MYNVFHRTWWVENPAWPKGLEPQLGKKHYLVKGVNSEKLARELCEDWNEQHEPGRLSDKAEYESVDR
jgi:hypothetical protein